MDEAGPSGWRQLGARQELPPVHEGSHASPVAARPEHRAARDHRRRRDRCRAHAALGQRAIARGRDELRELRVGDFGLVHPEPFDRRGACGPFLRKGGIRTESESCRPATRPCRDARRLEAQDRSAARLRFRDGAGRARRGVRSPHPPRSGAPAATASAISSAARLMRGDQKITPIALRVGIPRRLHLRQLLADCCSTDPAAPRRSVPTLNSCHLRCAGGRAASHTIFQSPWRTLRWPNSSQPWIASGACADLAWPSSTGSSDTPCGRSTGLPRIRCHRDAARPPARGRWAAGPSPCPVASLRVPGVTFFG